MFYYAIKTLLQSHHYLRFDFFYNSFFFMKFGSKIAKNCSIHDTAVHYNNLHIKLSIGFVVKQKYEPFIHLVIPSLRSYARGIQMQTPKPLQAANKKRRIYLNYQKRVIYSRMACFIARHTICESLGKIKFQIRMQY